MTNLMTDLVIPHIEIPADKILMYLPFATLCFVVNYFRHLICNGVRWCEVWIALFTRIRLIDTGYKSFVVGYCS